jgi:DNA replication protein DnaC
LIYGENGTGKSHASKAVYYWANRIAMNIPLIDAETGVRTADAIMVNWPTVVDGFKRNDWDLDDLYNCALLVIDDIGAEHDPSRVGIEKLYTLLERRINRWTLITTNVSPDQWEFKFERRIADRLCRNCQHVDLSQVPSFASVTT